jgi:hypothetical protein
VRRTRGIVERAVCRKARATVLLRVVALEQEGLVGLHVWEVKPSMSKIEDEAQSFAYAIRINEIARDGIIGSDAPCIAERQWRILQRPVDGAPDIDFGELALQRRSASSARWSRTRRGADWKV